MEKALGRSAAPENIRMNNVLPGFIDSLPKKQEFPDRIPMERYGKPVEIAATVTFLAPAVGGCITGQTFASTMGLPGPSDLESRVEN